MNIVFLCRDGAASRYVAHELHAEVGLGAIVVESGEEAKARKFTREWNSTSWWKTPLLGLDLLAVTVYEWVGERAIQRRLRGHPSERGYPEGVSFDRVDEANDLASVFILQEVEPDIILSYRTSTLRPPVLSIPSRAVLNVHNGVVPGYRNVHSELWAVLNGDLGQIGCTILHLDAEEDTAAVALEERLAGANGFWDVRWQNVRLAARMAVEALRLYEAGALPRIPQEPSDIGFHPAPGVRALARLALKKVQLPG